MSARRQHVGVVLGPLGEAGLRTCIFFFLWQFVFFLWTEWRIRRLAFLTRSRQPYATLTTSYGSMLMESDTAHHSFRGILTTTKLETYQLEMRQFAEFA